MSDLRLCNAVCSFQPLASLGKSPGDLRWGALAARVRGSGALCADTGRWLRIGALCADSGRRLRIGGRSVRIADAGDWLEIVLFGYGRDCKELGYKKSHERCGWQLP